MMAGKIGFSQISGSLLMLPDNFYGQMLNPSYMRSDEATIIAVPGLAGISFSNQGNFKISDLIVINESGNPVIDFQHFYENANLINSINESFIIPLIYIGLPVKKGMVSFYYNENIKNFARFKIYTFDFLLDGNFPEEYRSFNTEELNLFTNGYREFAFGYARNFSKKIDVGIRFKILFGEIYANLNDWDYGLETSTTGQEVRMRAVGNGQLSVPFSVILSETQQIDIISGKSAVSKYFGAFQNPGLAIDFGATYFMDESNTFSFALRDIGGIWFRKNTYNLEQRGDYYFTGFDLTSAVQYPGESGYIYPSLSMLREKENIRKVFRPFADTTRFVENLSPKMAGHYQYKYSEELLFGITNQMVFRSKHFQNTFTLTSLQKQGIFSFFENVNFYGLEDVTIGGGIQLETKYFQAFFAADNLFAFYHPANQKTFSLSLGACILLNKEKDALSKGGKSKKIHSKSGKTSKEWPFFRNKN